MTLKRISAWAREHDGVIDARVIDGYMEITLEGTDAGGNECSRTYTAGDLDEVMKVLGY